MEITRSQSQNLHRGSSSKEYINILTQNSAYHLQTADQKTASEYDQEIPQSHTAEQPALPRGRATEQNKTPGRHFKQSNQLTLTQQDDCKT